MSVKILSKTSRFVNIQIEQQNQTLVDCEPAFALICQYKVLNWNNFVNVNQADTIMDDPSIKEQIIGIGIEYPTHFLFCWFYYKKLIQFLCCNFDLVL